MKEVGIVIDMGGTTIKIGLVEDAAIIDHTKIVVQSYASLHENLSLISDIVDTLLSKNKCQPIGIGLAFPGIVDAPSNKILSKYVKYPDAQDVDLSMWAEERWGLPIVIENDARAALLGEWKFGAGKECENLVLVTLGTGFGSAAMMDGKLLRGRNHIAGNLGGHMTINLHGSRCNCGNVGCLETECSSWAIEKYVTSLPEFAASGFSTSDISFRHIFKHSAAGNAFMKKVLDHCLNVWSMGIISLIHAYDPERIILGGGIMKSSDVILPYVEKMVKTHSWVQDGSVEIVSAARIEFAGILGMYHLCSEKNRTKYNQIN